MNKENRKKCNAPYSGSAALTTEVHHVSKDQKSTFCAVSKHRVNVQNPYSKQKHLKHNPCQATKDAQYKPRNSCKKSLSDIDKNGSVTNASVSKRKNPYSSESKNILRLRTQHHKPTDLATEKSYEDASNITNISNQYSKSHSTEKKEQNQIHKEGLNQSAVQKNNCRNYLPNRFNSLKTSDLQIVKNAAKNFVKTNSLDLSVTINDKKSVQHDVKFKAPTDNLICTTTNDLYNDSGIDWDSVEIPSRSKNDKVVFPAKPITEVKSVLRPTPCTSINKLVQKANMDSTLCNNQNRSSKLTSTSLKNDGFLPHLGTATANKSEADDRSSSIAHTLQIDQISNPSESSNKPDSIGKIAGPTINVKAPEVDLYGDDDIDWGSINIDNNEIRVTSQLSTKIKKTENAYEVDAKHKSNKNTEKYSFEANAEICAKTLTSRAQNKLHVPVERVAVLESVKNEDIMNNGAIYHDTGIKNVARGIDSHVTQLKDDMVKLQHVVAHNESNSKNIDAPHTQTHIGSSVLEALRANRPTQWNSSESQTKLSNALETPVCKTKKPQSSLTIMQTNQVSPLPPNIVYSPKRILPVEDDYRQLLIKNANISETLPNGWKLLPHQKLALLRGFKMRRLVLAYDMGLGKTLIACVWAKSFKKTFEELKVFIIAPISLHGEWEKTAREATEMPSVRETDNPMDMEMVSWAKIPPRPHPSISKFVVVCDEAHSIQSMNSARTKDTLKLVGDKRCIGCLLLSGTPMKNGKPSNLFPLLRAVRHPFGDKQKAFETQFCAGHEKNFGRGKAVWDANGSSNLEQLKFHIASHVLRKTKEECLKELPEKKREYIEVSVSSRHELKHSAAMNNLAKCYKNCCGNSEKDSEDLLGTFAKLRLISSLSKVDACVALAKSTLETEPAIVIFTNFVDVAKDLHQKLSLCGWSGELLTGQTPAKKRHAMVENFQSGVSPAFICTFGAGGVGLTLTAACVVILLDRPWTVRCLQSMLSMIDLLFCK